MKTLVAIVLAVVVAGAGVAARQGDPNVNRLVEQYQTAWNKGDAKALAALYSQTAIRMQPEGPVAGRAAIEQMFTKNFAEIWKGTKLTLKAGRTQKVTADVSILEGTYEVAGGAGAPQRGRFLNTLVREGAEWKLASVTPVPETPAK